MRRVMRFQRMILIRLFHPRCLFQFPPPFFWRILELDSDPRGLIFGAFEMKLKYVILLSSIIVLFLAPTVGRAQLPTDAPKETVNFYVVFDSLSLALDTWDAANPPESVKMAAYEVASGFLAGVPYHYKANRDRVSIIQQVDKVANDLKYIGESEESGCVKFQYSVDIPSDTVDSAKIGKSYQGKGESDDDNLAVARDAALKEALGDAVKTAISEAFIQKNNPLPGVLDGRITWYEITSEGRDDRGHAYNVEVNAWVNIPKETTTTPAAPPPAQPARAEPQNPPSGQNNGQS